MTRRIKAMFRPGSVFEHFTDETLQSLAAQMVGKPVMDRPGGEEVLGFCVAAEVVGDGIVFEYREATQR